MSRRSKIREEQKKIMLDPVARKAAEDALASYQATLYKPDPRKPKEKPFESADLTEALAANTYIREDGEPRIVLKEIGPQDLGVFHRMQVACPAECFSLDDGENARFDPRSCLECGACRIIGEHTLIESWEFPEHGCGVEYRFG